MNEASLVSKSEGSSVRLGLKENWRQFAILILVNALVGAMVGVGCSRSGRRMSLNRDICLAL
jgi:hypothetical protein